MWALSLYDAYSFSMAPTEATNGGQVQLPKISTTGLPFSSESLTVFLPSMSLMVKSVAASPTFNSRPLRSRGLPLRVTAPVRFFLSLS